MLLIKIVNDGSGDSKTGNYDYEVFVNKELIASGKVENHNREEGWRKLVRMLADQKEPKESVPKKKSGTGIDWSKIPEVIRPDELKLYMRNVIEDESRNLYGRD